MIDPEELNLISYETDIMKFLNHHGVVKYIETIESMNKIYIITELIEGGNLFEYIMSKEYLEGYYKF